MKVTIIIVEYKDVDIVKRAVDSIFDWAEDAEVIVISNSSYNDIEQEAVTAELSACRLVFQENVGFSKAVNKGIKLSKCDLIMLFNPDAEMIDSSFQIAIDYIQKNPPIAVVGPMIYDERKQIQDSCREFMTLGIFLKRALTRMFKKVSGPVLEKKDYFIPMTVDWVSGACMLVRKAAIDQVGPMDDRYFMYVEDMDWCRTFKKNGWKIWYLPEWRIEHNAGRGSSGGAKIFNKLMWIHIHSLIKYFIKWRSEK